MPEVSEVENDAKVKSTPHPSPLPEGEGADRDVMGLDIDLHNRGDCKFRAGINRSPNVERIQRCSFRSA
jgi:hypothetical protein